MKTRILIGLQIAVIAALLHPGTAEAKRDIHWQVNPTGFPTDVSVFVDVEENGVFKSNLKATNNTFAVSIDEFAGDQGGWIANASQVAAGQAGANVMIIIDISSSYTKTFSRAKQIAQNIVRSMDPSKDQIAVYTAPASSGFQESAVVQQFTSDSAALSKAIDSIHSLPSDDKTGARLCNALSEGLDGFPENDANRYRAMIFITGGADKGEGKGDCVNKSYENGLVPFFPIVLKLDKRYDDPRNAHKIENRAHELATNTGGRSIYRKSDATFQQFVTLFWNRVRSQYLLKVRFPCYKPEPVTKHISLLKVENNDADMIKFKATSVPAPIPQITTITPLKANSKDVEDGKVDITIDGDGFCGHIGSVKVYVNDTPAVTKSQHPFRVVATLNQNHKTGTVKVINQYAQKGESKIRFTVVAPPKGERTSATLLAMVVAIIALSILSIVVVSMRKRTAKAGVQKAKPVPKKSDVPTKKETSTAKTMAMTSVDSVWVERIDGKKDLLKEGENIIGREDYCAIKLSVAGVSREHAKLTFDQKNGLVWIEDMGSMNGTYAGNERAGVDKAEKLQKRRLVSSGDAVWIGGEKLVIRFDGGVQGEA